MKNKKKITVLIPCYNEEKGIGKVIDGIPQKKLNKLGYTIEIIVIDNNSSDKTVAIAQKKGVQILSESKKGKGHALKKGFYAIDSETDYVVMLDGDNTYKGNELLRMIEPLENKFADAVIGSRLGGKLNKGSLLLKNRIANWTYTFLVRHFYYANTTDVLSGYFAWDRQVIEELREHLTSTGFSIEMEMITKMTKLGYYICSVPITYDKREGESKIDSIKDGLLIFNVFFKNLFWTPKRNKSRNTSTLPNLTS